MRIDRLLGAAAAAAPLSLAGGGPQAKLFGFAFNCDGKVAPSAGSDDLPDATND